MADENMERLLTGDGPERGKRIRELSVGIDFLSDFWKEKYLEEYIKEGGSKIKFVTGRPGSGKSHFLQLISGMAADMGLSLIHISPQIRSFPYEGHGVPDRSSRCAPWSPG